MSKEKLKPCHVNGWLDRQGKLYPCKFMGHNKLDGCLVMGTICDFIKA